MCRQCHPSWDTVIGFIARRDHLDPTKKADLVEICHRAMPSQELPISADIRRNAPEPAPAYAPPAEEWQETAKRVIDECQEELWQPSSKKIRQYLHGRGLSDETIRRFRLGYCRTGRADVYGREVGDLWIPRGITIPCIVADEVWYIKIRLVPGVPFTCGECKKVLTTPGTCPDCGYRNKYRGVKGNRPAAIFNADRLAGDDVAILVEGEFDCMIADQQLWNLLPAVTMGSANNLPDLASWGSYLVQLKTILLAYDNDKAGQSGENALMDLIGSRIKLAPIPDEKDLNDFYLAGGDLQKWIQPHLDFYGIYRVRQEGL